MKEKFTGFSNIFAYSAGMAGWSIMMNTVSVMLIFLYIPPSNSEMQQLVPATPIIGILTVFSVILASGRLIDAVTDPIIAWVSDTLRTKWGRRVPVMFIAIIPTTVFSVLLFFPPHDSESQKNLEWLFIMQAGFYIFLTLYIVPYNALMPELAETKSDKLNLSMYLSLAYVLGIIIASQVPFLSSWFAEDASALSRNDYRFAMIIINSIALFLMFLPILVVNENKYCKARAAKISVVKSLKTVINNRRFSLFLIADASFFITIAIITSGMLYYVKVLLDLPEMTASIFMGGMIVLSLFCYPIVLKLAKTWGKKRLVLISFGIFAFMFIWISFMGKLPLSSVLQMVMLAIITAFPTAVLGILPYAIIAEAAEASAQKTGENTEGMFFAVRTFADKFGQTIGITGFAILMVLGKDPGNDTGIRLSAWLGFFISAVAFVVFLRWEE